MRSKKKVKPVKRPLTPSEILQNQRNILVSKSYQLVEKHFDRDALRAYCSLNNLHFSLRTSKANLATSICTHMLNHGQQLYLKEIIEVAREHWVERVEVNDRHRPLFYKSMIEKADLCISSIDDYVEKINEGRRTR